MKNLFEQYMKKVHTSKEIINESTSIEEQVNLETDVAQKDELEQHK